MLEKVSRLEGLQRPGKKELEGHFKNLLETELIFSLKLIPALKFGLNLLP